MIVEMEFSRARAEEALRNVHLNRVEAGYGEVVYSCRGANY